MKNISDFFNEEYEVYAKEIRTNYPQTHYNHYKTIKNFFKNNDDNVATFITLSFGFNMLIGVFLGITLNLSNILSILVAIIWSFIGSLFILKLGYMIKSKFFMKNKFDIEKEINNSFNNKKISEEMHNLIKLELSMNEYKMLSISYGKNMNFTYSDILSFIKDRENINKKFQNIEDDKNSIILSENELLYYQK